MVADVVRQAQRRLLSVSYRAFGMLPPRVRRAVVGLFTPSFTVGALAVIHDGPMVLFVRQQHHPGLALPGGLLKKGEPARQALSRELAEEVGIDAAGLAGAPDTAHVDPARKRVDLIWFLAVDRETTTVRVGGEILSHEWRGLDDAELTGQTVEILAGVDGRFPR